MKSSPNRRPRRPGHLRHGVFALMAATTLLVGCTSGDSDSTASSATDADAATAESISIELARSPIPAPGQTTTPVYGILVNDSLETMRVISATSPVADSVDLLGPENAVVLPAEGLEVLADGGLVMEPANFKLLLNGIDPDALEAEIPVTLRFESGESFDFSAVLQELDQ